MNRLRMIAVVGLSAAVLLAVAATTSVWAQQAGKTRPLKTKQLMKGLVAPNCGALKKALDAGPADDAAWEALTLNAALLNEANYILMADGRCPDAAWAAAAKTLGGCSDAVLKAAEAKDVEKAKTAFTALTKACAACHKVHKK